MLEPFRAGCFLPPGALDAAAMLVASDLGRPVYEQLGFRALHRATFWLVPR